eukprot:c9007_g1_i1.p1 GENE.c9007_g1_i1~~c9007_g1_i1.p1  ORF type:complete len:1470 (+),score=397.75 c9007_g1_i1:657-4412(+)
MSNEYGPYEKRRSCCKWVRWVELAGGRVQGTKRRIQRRMSRDVHLTPTTHTAGAHPSLGSSPLVDADEMPTFENISDEFNGIPPLQLIDIRDSAQATLLFSLLHTLPHVVQYHLDENVFPETMAFQKLKLSASGQEIGGDLLFKHRIGFSGTPSNLIPKEFGECVYEAGDDAKMLSALTNANVVSVVHAPVTWSVHFILDYVATTADPPLNALIDTGALITSMSNFEVAHYLVTKGLNNMDGVVFLDESDRKMILLRKGMQVMELSQSGVSPSKRFSFYDQVHTTGMDISQAPNAVALVTLGKDMTFRDYAQGAYRMRGIGNGQTIRLLIIPEVLKLIERQMGSSASVPAPAAQPSDQFSDILNFGNVVSTLAGFITPNTAQSNTLSQTKTIICNVVGWLHINSMKTEHIQWNVLMQQCIKNIWRKESYSMLMKSHNQVGTNRVDDNLLKGIEVFRERVDHHVANHVADDEEFCKALNADVKKFETLLKEPQKQLLFEYKRDLENRRGDETDPRQLKIKQAQDFGAEQVQEQQQEQEQEQQRQQEKEQEREQEIEIQNFLRKKYSRTDESVVPWPISVLEASPSSTPFYPLSTFSVCKKLGVRSKPLSFPSFILLSQNHYRQKWLDSFRRLKNVVVILDWVPNRSLLRESSEPRELTQAQEAKLATAFKMFDVDKNGTMSKNEMVEMLKAVDVDVGSEKDVAQLFDSMDLNKDGQLSFEEIKQAVARQTFYALEEGRHMVVLCLAEAEHLRGLLHAQSNSSVSTPSLGLSTIGGLELGHTRDFKKAGLYQHRIGVECCRLLDSQVDFDGKQITTLLRTLQQDGCDDRRDFFLDVRSCRRRRQVAWEQTPLAPLFLTSDEYHLLSIRAIISRLTFCLVQRGLFPLDAFRMFDSDQDGVLSQVELFNGLLWLGVEISRSQLLDLVASLDSNADNVISFEEFHRAFEESFLETQSLQITESSATPQGLIIPLRTSTNLNTPLSNPIASSPKSLGLAEGDSSSRNSGSTNKPIPLPTPEMLAALQLDNKEPESAKQQLRASDELISNIFVHLVPQNSYEEMWTSRGSMAHKKASVWHMLTHVGFSKANSKRVCLGDYAVEGFTSPNRKSKLLRMQLEDKNVMGIQSSTRLNDAARVRMPHPVRFRQVWSQQRGERPIYVWQPIPPSPDFVALGMLATNSEEPPEPESVHCVPKSWTNQIAEPPTFVWDDSGTGGRPGSIWRIGKLGLMVVTVGHEVPKGPFFELKDLEFNFTLGL